MLRAWLLVIAGVIGLASMRIAYDLTYEPAPAVRVRWRGGIGDWRRTWLEHRYRLIVQPTTGDLSYAYVLMDTRRSNIEAMVKDPEVADTADIDRVTFEIPWATEYESSDWMWVADRTPGLRQPVVRWALAAGLVAAVIAGLIRIVRAVAWTDRKAAAIAWWRRLESALKHG